MKLILFGLQNRIIHREDEGIYHYWTGQTYLPFKSPKQIFALFKKSLELFLSLYKAFFTFMTTICSMERIQRRC